MSWFEKIMPSRIKTERRTRSVPEGLWIKCPACDAVLYRAEIVQEQPGFPVDVVDTTGAGDAFNGTLAWAVANGETFETAIRLACAGGALATRALGARASLATADEVYALATA